MSTLGVKVWVRFTWRNTHKRKFGDSRCPLDDCSNVRMKLAFVWKGTVGMVMLNLISSRETRVAKLKLQTEHIANLLFTVCAAFKMRVSITSTQFTEQI